MTDSTDINQTRRDLLIGGALSATAAALPLGCAQGAEPAAATPAPVTAKVALRVNGQRRELELDTRTTLLERMPGLASGPHVSLLRLALPPVG